jgi:DNA-binding Lrp family transcriptional regulator
MTVMLEIARAATAFILLAFRTDFARVEAGWLTAVVLKLGVTEAPVAAVGRALVQCPETRFCVAIVGAGAASIFVTMQLHSLSSLDGVLSRLIAEYRGVTVLDTHVVLHSVKSWGRLLGPDGHARHVVPVDLWAPATARHASAG